VLSPFHCGCPRGEDIVVTNSLLLQNLRDALDNIYDAKVPKTWKKVKFKGR